MEVINRKEAKEQGLSKYFTGKPCKHGHISSRTTVNGICDKCTALYQHNNLDKKRIRAKRYYDKNSDKCRESSRIYRIENPERVKQYNRKYSKENLAYFNEYSNRRYILKMNRIPKWADLNKIKEIYAEASHISQETGIKHHVDHYYPLQGKLVSGLHVPENLRIIPASENLAKNNKHPDEL